MSNDVDCEHLIERLAGPLPPPDRVAFRRAAEEAVARLPCAGEGAMSQTGTSVLAPKYHFRSGLPDR
jgi:hypothetical protein